MGLPKIFCCCCDLQTGGVVLGWCWAVISIFVLTGAAIYMNIVNGNIRRSDKDEPELTIIYNFLTYELISSIINLVASIFLLAGAQWKKPMLLVPWLIGQMALIVGYLVTTIIACVFLFTFNYGGGVGFLVFLFGFSFSGVCLYWWLCMASLFKKWRREENSVCVVNTPMTPAPSGGISLQVSHAGLPPAYSLSPGMPPSYSTDVSSQITHSHGISLSHAVSSGKPPSQSYIL